MKKGIQRFWAALAGNIRGMTFVTRYPRTDKSSRNMTFMWALALLLAVWSVGMYLRDRDYGSFFLWMNSAILVLDAYMLRLSILGIGYRRSRRGKTSRRALP